MISKKFSGDYIDSGHDDYNFERLVFNGIHQKRPKGILKCKNETDVQLALEYVLECGDPFCIRAGGHSVAGKSTIDDGFIIDLANMRSVKIDEKQQIAKVSGGATWRDFDLKASHFGLATTGGIISNTGVGGLTLGGGLGWLMGANGLACDNLIGARVLLGNGDIISVNSSSNMELLFALRGGYVHSCIVLEFEFEMMQVDRVLAGSLMFEFSNIAEVIRRFSDHEKVLSNATTVDVVLGTSNSGTKFVSIDGCSLSEGNNAELDWDLLRGISNSVQDSVSWRRYVDWQTEFDDVLRRGRRAYWKSISIPELSEDVIRILLHYFNHVPSIYTQISIDCLRGVALLEKNGRTYFPSRENRYVILINSAWLKTSEDIMNIDWTRKLFHDLSKVVSSASVYRNYLDSDEREFERISYHRGDLRSLALVKEKYDAKNIFSSNSALS